MRLLETTCAISVACLCLSLSTAPQLPVPKEPPQPFSPTKSRNPVIDVMQGAWKLTKVESLTMDKERRMEAGYLLVAGDFFSFELHIGWQSPNGNALTRVFQSGTHRFEIDDKYKMTTSSLIGSINDPKGLVLFEQPGHRREYTVDCDGDTLKMKREDETTFEFERLQDNRPKRDFYGRPIKEKKPDEKKPETPVDGGKETPPKKD
jgi:hypothetical protein